MEIRKVNGMKDASGRGGKLGLKGYRLQSVTPAILEDARQLLLSRLEQCSSDCLFVKHSRGLRGAYYILGLGFVGFHVWLQPARIEEELRSFGIDYRACIVMHKAPENMTASGHTGAFNQGST